MLKNIKLHTLVELGRRRKSFKSGRQSVFVLTRVLSEVLNRRGVHHEKTDSGPRPARCEEAGERLNLEQ